MKARPNTTACLKLAQDRDRAQLRADWPHCPARRLSAVVPTAISLRGRALELERRLSRFEMEVTS